MRFTKTIATALAVTVGALSFASSADARSRDWRHGGHAYKPYHNYHHGFRHHRFHDDDDFSAGAAIFGFAAGAVLGSALSRPCYNCGYGYGYAPAYSYAPAYPAPVVVYQPWTPTWFTYCHGKYRSFNANTGYYLGYDGDYHFCR
jgi:hypothetical protein